MKSQQYHQTRRNFLKKSILTGALFPLVPADLFAITASNTAARLKIHIFSKHLQFLNYRDMANAVAELGFDGIDLTVRPKGHVLPERVEDDLPKAIAAIRKVGLVSSMMVTAVDDASDPIDKKVLAAAAKLGPPFQQKQDRHRPQQKCPLQRIRLNFADFDIQRFGKIDPFSKEWFTRCAEARSKK